MNFTEEKKTGLLGITTVLTEVGEDGATKLEDPFRIEADKAGVRFRGTSRHVMSLEDLNLFAKQVAKAWRLHESYRPKVTNAAGH